MILKRFESVFSELKVSLDQSIEKLGVFQVLKVRQSSEERRNICDQQGRLESYLASHNVHVNGKDVLPTKFDKLSNSVSEHTKPEDHPKLSEFLGRIVASDFLSYLFILWGAVVK